MANTTPKRHTSFTSPEGTFKYPKLNTPDTKFNPLGEYGVKLVLPEAEAAGMIEAITEKVSEAEAEAREQLQTQIDNEKGEKKAKAMAALKNLKAAPLPYKDCVGDDGEPNGMVEFNIKMKASRVDAKTGKKIVMAPKLFDAKGDPISQAPSIWGGTRGCVAGQYIPYFTPTVGYGVSLRLSAAQIVKLVNSSGGSADQFGFGAKAGGYEADEDSFAQTYAEEAAASASSETADEF